MNLAALYIYWGIIGWIFITALGLPPIPEEAAVAGLGAWVHQNPDAIVLFAWLICLGAVLGTDLFLYMIGRLGGRRLLHQKYVQHYLKPERVQTFSRKFQERGVWFMMTARLVPGWRTAVFITAGSIHYPVGRFVIADAISSVPLVTFFFFGGYFAADWINDLIGNLHQAQYLLLFLAFLALLVVGLVLYLRWLGKRQREEAIEEAQTKREHEAAVAAGPVELAPGCETHPRDPHDAAFAPAPNGAHAPLRAERPVNAQP